MEEIYIPKIRIRALRKNSGRLKELKLKTGCEILFDKEGNYVRLDGKEVLSEYLAKKVISAFGRGFGVKEACKLMDDRFYLKIINFKEFARNKDRRERIMARLIGTDGRAKLHMEEVSSANISIYGDTISIIGDIDAVQEAEVAIKTVIEGGSHRSAYIRMNATHRIHKK